MVNFNQHSGCLIIQCYQFNVLICIDCINSVKQYKVRIVIPVVVGSSPISHPNIINKLAKNNTLGFFVCGALTDYLQTAVHGFVPWNRLVVRCDASLNAPSASVKWVSDNRHEGAKSGSLGWCELRNISPTRSPSARQRLKRLHLVKHFCRPLPVCVQ